MKRGPKRLRHSPGNLEDPGGWVAGVVALEKEKRKDKRKSNKLEHSYFFASILCGSEYNECKVLQNID